MSHLSDDESLSSADPLPIDQRDLPLVASSAAQEHGNALSSGAAAGSPDHHQQHGSGSKHQSPTPHYSTSLSHTDQILLQLPASERAIVNHLLAENGTLRARVKALTVELNDARDIFSRRGRMFLSRLSASDTTKGVQTRDVKGLAPLRTVKKQGGSIEDLDGPNKESQTDESFLEGMSPFMGADYEQKMAQLEALQAEKEARAAKRASSTGKVGKSLGGAPPPSNSMAAIAVPGGGGAPRPTQVGAPAADEPQPNEAQLLKAEIMKLKAENASLQHSIELLRAGGAKGQPEVQAAHSATMQRVDELYRSLIESITKVSQAEAQVSELKAQLASSGNNASPRSTNNKSGSNNKSAMEAAPKPVQYSKGQNTDRVLDMHVSSIPQAAPSGRPDESVNSDYVNSLVAALESTRAQLSSTLKQLAELSGNEKPPSSVSSTVSERLLGGRKSVAVSTGASVNSRIEDLFGKYNTPYTPDVVEDLLKNKDAPMKVVALHQQLQQRNLDDGATIAMSTALSTEVDALRNELLASHVAMDEMQYSLDLERRTGPGATQKANNSAARDIAVLCDIVHASKTEIENLREQVKEITKERNIAVNDFQQLQQHFRKALIDGEQLVDAHQDATDENNRKLIMQLRSQESENITLKAEIQTLNREIDKIKKQKEAYHKDVFVLRERTSQLQASLAQLRTDHTAQAQEIRQLRAHAGLAKGGGGDTKEVSASRNSNVGVGAAGNRGVTSKRATTPTTGSGGGVSRNGGKSAAPAGVGVGGSSSSSRQQAAFGSTSELEAQYEELRSCFLDLAALVPNDLQTARQVSDRILKEYRALQARVNHLEKDLKKRMATMANARNQVEEAKTKQLNAEQKARTLQTANKRAVHNKKIAEDAAKQFDDKIDVMHASREELATKVEALEAELEATRDALIATRNEVEVGRKMMMQLINDDEQDVGQLVSAAESKLAQVSP